MPATAAAGDKPVSEEAEALLCVTDDDDGGNTAKAGQGKILFIIANGGGGHKATANAVRDCLEMRDASLARDVEFLDASALIDRMLFGPGAEREKGFFDGDAWYNWFMRSGYYRIAAICGYIAVIIIWLHRKKIVRGFEQLWKERQPTVVVSFIPHCNGVMRSALRASCPSRTLLTVATDMASIRSHCWLDAFDASAVKHVVALGSRELQQQADELGYPAENVLKTSGMVVNPVFYASSADGESDGSDAHDSSGTVHDSSGTAHDSSGTAAGASSARVPVSSPSVPDSPTVALVFFGGFAPMRTARIVHAARRSHPQIKFVVLCGGNSALEARLRRELEGPLCVVEGMLPAPRIRQWLRAASFVIGKTGPGVVAEATVCRVPFVTEDRSVMPQERSVLRWLQEEGVGVVLPNLEWLPIDLLERLAPCRKAVQRQENRAVFEVTDCVQTLIARNASSGHW